MTQTVVEMVIKIRKDVILYLFFPLFTYNFYIKKKTHPPLKYVGSFKTIRIIIIII